VLGGTLWGNNKKINSALVLRLSSNKLFTERASVKTQISETNSVKYRRFALSMSDPQKKLKGQVDKLRVDPLLAPTCKPVLISDSKWFNLKSQVRVNPETFIEFWSFQLKHKLLTNHAMQRQ
jgi:hypothetical protein